jgi:hypothetical protein
VDVGKLGGDFMDAFGLDAKAFVGGQGFSGDF